MSKSDDAREQVRKLDDLMARLQRVMAIKAPPVSLGLTTSQIFILRYLDRCAAAKASDIARVSGLSPGAVTQVCDELVRQGFVERERSSDDRRVVHVRITPAGRAKLEEVRQLRVERLMTLLDRLHPEDVDHLIRIIGQILDIVENESNGGRA